MRLLSRYLKIGNQPTLVSCLVGEYVSAGYREEVILQSRWQNSISTLMFNATGVPRWYSGVTIPYRTINPK